MKAIAVLHNALLSSWLTFCDTAGLEHRWGMQACASWNGARALQWKPCIGSSRILAWRHLFSHFLCPKLVGTLTYRSLPIALSFFCRTAKHAPHRTSHPWPLWNTCSCKEMFKAASLKRSLETCDLFCYGEVGIGILERLNMGWTLVELYELYCYWVVGFWGDIIAHCVIQYANKAKHRSSLAQFRLKFLLFLSIYVVSVKYL